jgi:cytochrome oxidase Cu insertion factor (SCO1/SenC/PrrC family)
MRPVLLLAALGLAGWCADDRPRLAPVPKPDQNATTGPAVGSRIPPFDAVDQDGKVRTFDNLRGPNGLVLLFVRSADW